MMKKCSRRGSVNRILGLFLGLAIILTGAFAGFGAAMLSEPQEAYAALGSGGMYENMYWEISDSGVLTVRPSGGKSYGRWVDNRYTNGTVAGGWPWKAHAESITEVKIQETIGSSPNTDLKNMFSDLPNVTKIDISGFNFGTNSDGSQGDSTRHTIRSLEGMFQNCPKLTEIVGLDVLAHNTVTNTKDMFKGCTSLTTADFNALDVSKVQDMRGMFQNCSSLTELDLSNWTNDGTVYQMQDFANGCSSLKKFTLNNPGFETRVLGNTSNPGKYKNVNTSGGTGCQTQRMFQGCNNLQELDLSNITISTWKGTDPSLPLNDDQQNTFVRSIGGENSDGLPNLRILNMNNIKLPGLKAGVLGGELVHGKNTLEEFYFGGDIDIDDSINDGTHDKAYDSGLEEIVDKLIERCYGLRVIDLSGWDTSALKDQGDGINYTVFDFKDLIEQGSLKKLIAEDVTLKDGSKKPTAIWMLYEKPDDDSSTVISEFDISDQITRGELEGLHIDWVFDFNQENQSDDDKIDLDSNSTDAKTLHAVISSRPLTGALGGGTYEVSNAGDAREPFTDENGNSTIPRTYYLVNNIGQQPPKLYYKGPGSAGYTEVEYDQELGDYYVREDSANGGWRIFAKPMNMTQWDNIQTNDGKLDDSYKLKIVYPQAAVDVNGKIHDVVVDINSVTFKDMNLIPTLKKDETTGESVYKLDPYGVNPWEWGAQSPDGTVWQRTDQDKLVGTNGVGNNAVYDENQEYTRELIGALQYSLDFWNQIYDTTGDDRFSTDPTQPDHKKLSKGSGTYIDYDIKIDDALPDTSVLFWMGDLDVAHSQEWNMHPTDNTQDTMTRDAYGPGSEGIVLGKGNDLNTLVFANNTGLERYDYNDDYTQSHLSKTGNYVVGTATDPDTSWSRFYVRADSQGANYIWTSGISCKTTILRSIPLEPEPPLPVYVIPEALKTVNFATPAGAFKDAFTFTIQRANEFDTLPYNHPYIDEDNGENGSAKTTATEDLRNLVPDDFRETQRNDGGVIPFSILEFETPGIDYRPMVAHDHNGHDVHAYVYKITENTPTDQGEITYNKEKVVYFMKVIVSDPKTDLEMYKGTRADVTIGTYTYEGENPPVTLSSAEIQKIKWDEDNTKTIWSQDAVWAGVREYAGQLGDSTYPTTNPGEYKGIRVFKDAYGTPYYYYAGICYAYSSGNPEDDTRFYEPRGRIAGDGRKVFVDASGKQFYLSNGKFRAFPGDEELSVAQYEQLDVKVEFEGEEYTVYMDKDGVQYIKVEKDGKTLYLDPDTLDTENPLREVADGNVFPTKDDQTLAEEKKIQKDGASYVVKKDVHGKAYIEVGGKYYDASGSAASAELTVDDATFNPDTSDRVVYVEATKEHGDKTYVLKQDALGTKYYEVPGAEGALSSYFDENGNTLGGGTAGAVAPSTTDKPLTRDNNGGEAALVVNGHTILEDVNKVRYYIDGGDYYSVTGINLYPGMDVTPKGTDQPVTGDYGIRQDESGQLFLKSEGGYNLTGGYTTTYYKVTKDAEGNYTLGDEYALPANLLDTSEAIVAGPFENSVKSGEIEIENKAQDGKAGEFTFEITFDSDFEPKNFAFDGVTPRVEETTDETTGDTTTTPIQFVKTGRNTYRFTLNEGQKVTIKDVPFEIGYTITEPVEANGWETVTADAAPYARSVSGKINAERYLANGRQNPEWKNSHVFENRFTELVVRKVVDGGSEDDKFTFAATATISGFGAGEEFSYGYIDEKNDQHFKTAKANEAGEATIMLDGFTLQDKKDLEDIVLVLPRGDENRKVEVTVTELNSAGYWTTWKVGDGEKADVDANGATNPIAMNTDKQVLTFTNRKLIATAGLDLQKLLDGRAFKDGDKFSFMLTAEDGTPMPVTWNSEKKEFTPTDTTVDATITAGTVSAKADFGIIKFSADDLDEPAEGQKTRSKTFTYQIMENPTDNNATGENAVGDTTPITNDKKVAEIKVTVTWDPTANEGKGAFFIDGQDATLYYDQSKDEFVDNAGSSAAFRAMVDLEDVFFTNEYDATGTWTPTATKVLNGRPLERDQFNFKLKGVPEQVEEGATEQWVKANPPMPAGTAEGAETQNVLQDVAVAAANKGTNGVNGPVSWDDITFTNEWLQKEVTFGSASAEQRAKVISWTAGNLVYGPIPDNAVAVVMVDGVSTGDAGVKFADATDAQRKAAQGTTADSKWQLGGKTYIDNLALVPDDAVGTYYEKTRTLTYKMWEDASNALPGYDYDSHNSEDSAYTIEITITENEDGTLTATPAYSERVEVDPSAGDGTTDPDNPVTPVVPAYEDKDVDKLVFTNYYGAEGDVTIKATKVLDGRALADDEFEFTLKNAKGEEVAKAKNKKEGSITFEDITFTQADLMDARGENYDALRTPDGKYQKTFIYTVSETSPGTDENGITRDTSTKTIAVTIREDGEGNISVVEVNNVAHSGGNTVSVGTFTNLYSSSGKGIVTAKKTLTGGKLGAGEFSFELYDNKGNKVAEATNAADGTITLEPVYNLEQVKADQEAGICTYTAAAGSNPAKWTYTYTVKELKQTTRDGDTITYDTTGTETGYTVTVDVVDDGKGTLTGTMTTEQAPEFTNKVEPVSISGTKAWVDVDESKTHNNANEVKLVLWSKAGDTTAKAATDADGKTIVDNAGYLLTRTSGAGTATSLTWNDNAYTIAKLPKYDSNGNAYTYWVVEDTADGYLPATYANADETTTDKALDGATITNVVAPEGSLTLKAKKILTGSSKLEDWAAGTFKVTASETEAGYTTEGTNVPTTGTLEEIGGEVVSTAEFELTTFRFKAFVEEEGDGAKTIVYLIDASGRKLSNQGVALENGESVITVSEGELTSGGVTNVDQSGATGKTLMFKITDNGDGTLKIEPANDTTTTTVELVNKHTDTVDVSIPIKKTLPDRDLKANEFEFKAEYVPADGLSELEAKRLAAGCEASDTAKNDADGKAAITLSFSKTGTYTYKVTEIDGGLGGVTYDTAEKTVTVKVSNDKDELVAAVTGASEASPLTFANTYEAKGSVDISVTKDVEGADWDDDMNFWFEIKDASGIFDTGLFSATPEFEGGQKAATKDRQTVSWTIDGFNKKNAFKANGEPKEFKFNIKEIDRNKIGGADGDWLLDTSTHTATVTFEDLGDGTLKPTVKYDVTTEKPEGTQHLTVTNTKKGQGLNLHATKQVTDADGNGDYWKSGDTYTLKLTALDGAPMPASASGTTVEAMATKDAPTVNFGTIVFDTVGNYTYEITEVAPAPAAPGITYDNKTYHAYVTVPNVGTDDAPIAGAPEVKYDITGSDAADSENLTTAPPTFTNKFKAAGEVALTATKVLEGANLADFTSDFKFTLYEADGSVARNKAGAEIKDITPDANGTINLGSIAYDADDLDLSKADGSATKTYVLRETVGNKAGITYDTADKPITVTIKLDGSETEAGSGIAKIAATQDATPTVTNTYAPMGEQVFTVSKWLDNRPITRAGFDFAIEGLGTVDAVDTSDYAATIASAAGLVPVPTTGTTAHVGAATTNYSPNGTASFGAITYTMGDLAKYNEGGDLIGYDDSRTFVYKIYETEGPNSSITYDDESKTEYYAFVTVKNDKAAGELKVTPTYVKRDVTADTYAAVTGDAVLKFHNVYDSTGTANVNAIKQVIGREWTSEDAFDFTIKPYQKGDSYGTTGGGDHAVSVTDPKMVPLPGNVPSKTDPVGNGNRTTAEGTATIDGRDVGNGEHFANFEPITFTDDMLTWDSTDGYLKGTFYYEITENTPVPGGFTQTGTTKFYAQVDVVDNRTGGITHHIYYYDSPSKLGDPSKHMHATPVFQNTYVIEDVAEIPVTKVIEGREWKAEDEFTFTLNHLNTAPLPDETTLIIGSRTPDHTAAYEIPVTIASLTSTTAAEGELTYSLKFTAAEASAYNEKHDLAGDDAMTTDDFKPVPAGVKYATFRYEITEDKAGETHAGLTYGDKLYAEVLVIDKLDGTVDTKITYYKDNSFAETSKLDAGAITNTYDPIAEPADLMITKAVVEPGAEEDDPATADIDESRATDAWEKLEDGAAFVFTIEPQDGAPSPKVYTEDRDALRTADEQTEVTLTADKKSDRVSIPILMSDLDKDTTGAPVATTFTYTVTEQPGDVTAVKYDTNPVTVQITATPNLDANSVALEYKYLNADGEELDGVTITNTYGVVDLTVDKEWNDGDADVTTHPAIPVTIERFANDEEEVLTELPAGAKVLDKDGNELSGYGAEGITVEADKMPITFTDLPAKTAAGADITYTASEGFVDGYRLSSTEYVYEGAWKNTFTNTLLTSVDVTKVWLDGDAADRPEMIVVGLIRDNSPIPVGFGFLDEDRDWAYTFDDLDAYDDEGNAISYSVKELGMPADYNVAVAGSQEDGYVITNTKLTDLAVTKTWIGGAAADVEFELYRSTAPSETSAFRTTEDGRHVWTVDESWTKVDSSAVFASSLFDYSETGDAETITVTGLPAFDENGRAYHYRVKEVVSGNAPFAEDQTSDLAVTNTNRYETTGSAKPTVVKELDGRPWLDSDTFCFKIEGVNVTDAAGNVIEGRTVPMPDNAIATVKADDAKVGAIGRSVAFDAIYFTGDDMRSADGAAETVRNFNYKIYEVDAAGNAVSDGSGITYDKSSHDLRIEVTDNGDGTLTTNLFWDGAETSSAVPVFTNQYHSEGVAKIWIEKDIHSRGWTETDAFTFDIRGVSGANLNIGGDTGADDGYQTRAMSLADVADPEEDAQQLSETLVAMGVHGNKYVGESLIDGEAYFIYEIEETPGNVEDLTYDTDVIYVRMHVTDNWDGTLSFEAEYFEDAACTRRLDDHKVWIVDDGTQKRLLNADERAACEAMTQEQRDEAGYRQVNTARFTNTLSTDVPVMKIWRGIPIEDVTVRVQQALLTPNADGTELTQEQIDAQLAAMGDEGWQAVARLEIPRGDFLNEAGEPIADAGIEGDVPVSTKTYTVEDLPMFVNVDGVSMRAVYRIVEEDTSDAYEMSYGAVRDGEYRDGERVFEQRGGTLVVTNTTTATNTASIAAVKQLLGRQWLADDDFEFTLEPIGRGSYNARGEFTGIDETKDIPMPADAAQGMAYAHATTGTQSVDTEGKLERLARFAAIAYTTDDLVYDEVDRHYQGDFFYKMKETANGRGGITYSGKESTVHVKVRENRTDVLTVQVAYDETTPGDIATGTQFTPVFTNRYAASASASVDLEKYLMGRDWVAGETFDFVMMPLAGAPFEDADPSEFAASATHSEEEREAALAQGRAVHTAEGAHKIRLKVEDASKKAQTSTFPVLRFDATELNKTTKSGEFTYSDGTAVPAGMAYGQFIYAFEEVATSADDLTIDGDTEYVRFTVIDRGDGTLDLSREFFEDRYASVPRFAPNADGTPSEDPATTVTFVNKTMRDIKVDPTKASISVVKELVGRDWKSDDTFEFALEPIGRGTYDEEGALTGNDDDKSIPMPAANAVTVEGEYKLSDSQRQAYFGDIAYELSDLIFVNGKMVGDFFYNMVEVVPDEATVGTDGRATLDGLTFTTDTHKVQVHVEEKNGSLAASVSYDGKPVGGAVPVFTNYFKDTSLVVRKTWASDTPEDRPESVKVQLQSKTADGEWTDCEGMVIELNADENWVGLFANLPVKDANGDDLSYRAVENEVPAGYTKYAETTAFGTTVITNALTPVIPDPEQIKISYIDPSKPEGERTITEETINRGDDEPAQPADPTRDGYEFVGWQRSVDPTTGDVTYEAKWKEIVTPDPEQIKITYIDPSKPEAERTIAEETINRGDDEPAQPADPTRDGYTFGGWNRTTDENGNVIYEANWIPQSQMVPVRIEWNDSDDQDGIRPDTVTVKLLDGEGNPVRDASGNEITAEVSEATNWTYIFDDLPTVDADGKPTEYRIGQVTPGGYTEEIQKGEDGMFTITDTHVPGTTTVTAVKVWTGEPDEIGSSMRDDVTLRLYGTVGGKVVYDAGEKVIAASGDSAEAKWENIPTHSSGTKMSWKVAEDSLYGYVATIEYSDGTNWFADMPENFDGMVRVTNNYVGPVTEVTATKVWEDQDDRDGIRPDDVTFVLYKKVGNAAEEAIDEITLGETDGWGVTWKDLPVTEIVGEGETATEEPVLYIVREKEIPQGYEAPCVEAAAPGRFNIINTHKVIEPISLSVTKEWAGEDGDTSSRKDVVFNLIKVVEGEAPAVVEGETRTIDAAASGDALTAVWTGLPAMEGGKKVTYTVDEAPIEGYTISMKDGMYDAEAHTISIVVTNTKNPTTPDPEKIKIVYSDPSKPEGSQTISENEINRGDNEPAQPAQPTRDGFIFGGWLREVDADGNVTYKAQWLSVPEPGQIRVTYTDGSGNTVLTEVIDRGENEPAQPAGPSREGFTFGGWLRDVDADGNVTYTANWVPTTGDKPRVIYIDPKADEEAMMIGVKTYEGTEDAAKAAQEKTDAPADPEHEGFTFVGWVMNQDELGDWVMVAKYNEVTPDPVGKTVTYVDPQSGKVLLSEVTDDVTKITAPEPEQYEGLTFMGWAEAEDASGNLIYMAQYTADCRNGAKDPTEPKSEPKDDSKQETKTVTQPQSAQKTQTTQKTQESSTSTKATAPKTGDTNALPLMSLAFGASLMTLLVTARKRRSAR